MYFQHRMEGIWLWQWIKPSWMAVI